MKQKTRLIIGGILLAGFGAMAFINLSQSMTPYVSFAEARAAGRAVQVAGFPDHQRARWDQDSGTFRFTMKNDDGELMPVSYAGVKPGNFDQAESVVIVGEYQEGTFEANQILVKCPSKYEAQQVEGNQHPGAADAETPASGGTE